MLIGSGGVVALVLGAWSVLWAVVAVPGARLRSYYPALFAFGGAIFAFAMLTAQSELALGLASWVQAGPDERAEVAAEVLSFSWRPLLGGALALAASWVTPAAVARQALDATSVPAQKASAPAGDPPSHWAERLFSLLMLPLAAFDLVVWVALRRAFERAVSGGESVMVALPKMQFLAALGAAACVGLLVLAGLIALIRMVRS